MRKTAKRDGNKRLKVPLQQKNQINYREVLFGLTFRDNEGGGKREKGGRKGIKKTTGEIVSVS